MAGLRGNRGERPFGERDERLAEVPRVRGAEPRLAYDRLRHARVAVADDRDVVVGVEEPALRLIDPNAFGADDVDRAAVGERSQKSAERVVPPLRELSAGRGRHRGSELARDLLRREPAEP